MPRPGLTPEQNERVRGHLRELLREHDGNQSALAPKLGITQPGLSSLLIGRVGTTYFMVQRIAKLRKLPTWEILGEPPPKLPPMPPRDLAAELVIEHGTSRRIVEALLEEPVQPEQEGWSAVRWIDHFRERALEAVRQPRPMFPPSPPSEERAPPSESGEMRVKRKPKVGEKPPARRKPG